MSTSISVYILALTLYGEAGNQSPSGIDLVAQVISNRAESQNKTYKQICLQKKQFSFWNGKHPRDTLKNIRRLNGLSTTKFQYCLYRAKNMPKPDHNGFYYYHTTNSHPLWSLDARIKGKFFLCGDHMFFNKGDIG